ncbi:MAG TPA: tetratricopeptide repeat protein [Methanothrix sp.]|nr:tetratricopeptide repeat protein [Methanothrix sp.]
MMTGDRDVSSLAILADALCQPAGYDPEQLRTLSNQGSDIASPFIEAILSSDENQIQKGLADLANSLSESDSFDAWFDLGRLAASLFFRHAAEEYFEKSADLARAQKDYEGLAKVYNCMGSLCSDDEDWDRACRFYEKALHIPEVETNPPLLCTILANLGRASTQKGDLTAAEKCCSRMLLLLDGNEHRSRADAFFSLGEIHQMKGEHDRAEECYQQSLSEREKAQDRRAMATSLASLASIYQITGEGDRVESCLDRAIHLLQDISDPLAEARMRFQLADFFLLEGRYNEACVHYEKSLPALQQGDSLLAARAQGRIGQCFMDSRDYAMAEGHLEKARRAMQDQGDQSSVSDLLILLASNYRLQNRLDEALQCSRQCLEIREQQGDCQAIADIYSCMGLIHADRREYLLGRDCFQKAADLLMQQGKWLSAAEALSNLASLCHLSGQLEDALSAYHRALEIFSEMGNEQGRYQTQANLGLVYQRKGELSLAEEYLQKSLVARDGSDMAGEASIKLSLGLTAQCKGEWDRAQDYLEQAAACFEDLGDLHGYSLAQNNLGNLHSDLGDTGKAILCYSQSLDARRAENDLHGMAVTMSNLAAAHSQEGELETAEEMYLQSLAIFQGAGDLGGEAKSLLGLAGIKAGMGELAESVKNFQASLQMGIDLGDSSVMTESLQGLVSVSLRLGLWQEVQASYIRVVDVLRTLGESEALAAALCSWGDLEADLGEWDHALQCYQESLEILELQGDEYFMAVARNNLANICYRRGDWTAALESYRYSRESFARVGDERSQASVLSNMASLCYKRGEWSQALECYQESLDLFERLDDLAGAAQVLGNLGNFYHRRGECSLAKEHFTRALEICRRLEDVPGAAEMQSCIDMLRPGRSEVPEDLDDYHKQLVELKAQGDLSGQAEVLSALAGSQADRCQWDAAISSYQKSLQLFSAVGEIYNQAQIRFNMALVYKDRGDLDEALSLSGDALEIFQRLDARPCIAQARLNMGTILGMKGQGKDAEDHFCQAIHLQEELEAQPDLCEGYLFRAQFLTREGRMDEARYYLNRAETLLSIANCPLLNIILCSTQGEVYQKEGRYKEAEGSFERALSKARMISNPYEEAKAIANLGRLCMLRKNYPEALDRLKKACSAMSRLGALFDSQAIYSDLYQLFLTQGDHARAKEMAALRDREAARTGHRDYPDRKDGGAQECAARKTSCTGKGQRAGIRDDQRSEKPAGPLLVQRQE